ncbi:hypothetical protein BH24CHL2_BH24CHL2_7100 [soil metagenome]|jgi:hypothetical protein
MEPYVMLEIVEQRQAYLRSIAAHRPSGPMMGAFRQTLGRGLVRFGRWVEGRCPEMAVETRTPESWSSVRVADGAH